ncbi:MAG TPA: NAD(P)-dependent oxidoreductase, partial [Thermoanaerobaculia bacterium]|nr:NAD(P)-dependent oxidoreductase [Thermoanaerobaculia bacterium]
KWCEDHGGNRAATPKEAAQGAEIVFMMVGDDPDIREIAYTESGILPGLAKGAILVDHTTASAEVAREVADACAKQDAHFIDAPVSGGEAGAVNGVLTIMCGGDETAFANARPVMECYGRTVTHLGPAGAGQLTKMVNQICIAGLVEALSEGLHFAERAGLDPRRVVAAISQGAAQSWQMDHRADTMIEGRFDFGFAVEWMRKDLGIALDEARRSGAQLPVTALVDQLYAEVEALGGERWDTSSLIARLRAVHGRSGR